MMGHALRTAAYKRQTGSQSLTTAQRKRAQKKLGHFLAKRGNTAVQTVEGASK